MSAGALLRSSHISKSLTRSASGLRNSSYRSPLVPISKAIPSIASDRIPLTVSTISSDTEPLSGCSSSLSISGIASANRSQASPARSRKQCLNIGSASILSQLSRSSL